MILLWKDVQYVSVHLPSRRTLSLQYYAASIYEMSQFDGTYLSVVVCHIFQFEAMHVCSSHIIGCDMQK